MSEVTKTTETRPFDNKTAEASFFLEQSAKAIMPMATDFEGTICVHVYSEKLAAGPSFKFATMFVGAMPEALAIESAKELKERLLARYGHTLKKRK